ncbi:MAG: hypothetical protein J6Y07_04655 [Alphaproteobacteria bacterium]|nr:hypothetical protein [Alphaproteobacteria bacterium]
MSGEKKSLFEFWPAVAWTGVYVFIMWAVLRGLFNFNMFSVAHLTKLGHLQLHGFAGAVFGILVLAAVPLYVATTVLAIRTKTMPIKIPLPKCFTETPPAPAPEPVVPVVVEQEILPSLPAGVPAEMRENFMRAQKNYGSRQMSVFNRQNAKDKSEVSIEQGEIIPKPVVETVSASTIEDVVPKAENAAPKTEDVAAYDGMPIPTDFDMDAPIDTADVDVPVFADINFDDDEDDSAKGEPESSLAKVCDWLRNNGIDASVDNDLIVANGYAVAVHDDEDFWVPDEIDWFAAGKQRPSPIVALKTAQKDKNLKPVLYLVTDSIMDLDKNSAEWNSDGIIVIKDKDEFLKLLRGE